MSLDDDTYEFRLTSAATLVCAEPLFLNYSSDGLALMTAEPFWYIYRGVFMTECLARCTSEAAALAARRLLS